MKPGDLTVVIAVATALTGAAGCGRTPAARTRATQAFANAPPPLKETWERAAASLQTNNYILAAPLLMDLRRQALSAEQAAAVDATLKPVMEALYAAADRGDAAAAQAIAALKRRPRH